MPVKVLEENRIVINRHLQTTNRRKASFTHVIAWVCVRALHEKFPQMNDNFAEARRSARRACAARKSTWAWPLTWRKRMVRARCLCRTSRMPQQVDFAQFLKAYDDIVKRARENKLQVSDFQNTTVSLTNPGTIGTAASTPRLMAWAVRHHRHRRN
ncbi:MAG: 2-oxo acid dehydrogenase subunit E2 [Pyrinomonadaceae bacterium]